jgi:hypothetical protein
LLPIRSPFDPTFLADVLAFIVTSMACFDFPVAGRRLPARALTLKVGNHDIFLAIS